jgi:hypothetical protein
MNKMKTMKTKTTKAAAAAAKRNRPDSAFWIESEGHGTALYETTKKAMKPHTKWQVNDTLIFNSVPMQITKIDAFGPTAHYGVCFHERIGKIAHGWIPVRIIDTAENVTPIASLYSTYRNYYNNGNCGSCGWPAHLHVHGRFCPVK